MGINTDNNNEINDGDGVDHSFKVNNKKEEKKNTQKKKCVDHKVFLYNEITTFWIVLQ